MPFDKEKIIKRIDCLIELAGKSGDSDQGGGEVFSGTINILDVLYGSKSQKCKAYIDRHNAYIRNSEGSREGLYIMVNVSSGVLKSIKDEIETGLIGNLELQSQGGIFGDFVTLARESLDDNKDVAAVLISAALEDTLKRFALQNGLDVPDADMSEVINALKSQGLLRGPQAAVVQSYVKLRNKAFHAEWDSIEKETVNSAIGFTETFLLEHFG